MFASYRYLLVLMCLSFSLFAQEIREYTVKRVGDAIEIDGRLDEASWQAAALSEEFVRYYDGAVTNLSTQAKFLWDDSYLYIGFICEDPDVWATFMNRDDFLWNEEVVEILCDPDGNDLNYFEIQVNPLETLLDLTLDKPYYQGGTADFSWTVDSLFAGVHVAGTLNDSSDTDTSWTCEVAIPFDEIAFAGPTLNFPPIDGESWRILVTRYDYERGGEEYVEISAWNQTDSRGFHVPEKFGRIIFSEDVVLSVEEEPEALLPGSFALVGNFPNPFNPSTTIVYDIDTATEINLSIYDLTGQKVVDLFNGKQAPGRHQLVWNGLDNRQQVASSGVYILLLQADGQSQARKMVLMK